MKITAPEYLLLLAIGVLNFWGALILASVRARASEVKIELPAAPTPRNEGARARSPEEGNDGQATAAPSIQEPTFS